MLAKYDISFLRRTKKCTVISIMTPTRNSSGYPRYSQVKSGCSYLIQDGLTLYLGFLVGVRGRAPPDKNRKSRSSKLPKKQSSILAPPIYFCYLFSFKSFTVPLGGPFLRGGGGCVRAWVNMI